MANNRLSGQPIVILGMFRSGTSCLAACLARMGVNLGRSDRFYPADQYNPSGYFELLPMLDATNRLLDKLGNSSARLRPLPKDWPSIPGIAPRVHQLESILVAEFAGHELWGWKSPQTSVLLPVFKEILDRHHLDPVYVISARFPLDVCRSTRSSAYLPSHPPRLLGLWLHYTLSSLVETIGCRRLVVKYESLISYPITQLRPLTDMVANLKLDGADADVLRAIVNGSLRHHAQSDEALQDWPPIVKETERLCRQLAQDPRGLNEGIYDDLIRAQWDKWQTMNSVSLLRVTEYPRGKISAIWLEGAKENHFDAPFTPVDGWQEVCISARTEVSGRLRVDLYQTPGLVWIRRAEWVSNQIRKNASLFPTPNGRLVQDGELLKLLVVGPYPIEVALPRDSGFDRLCLEIMVDVDQRATTEVIGVLRDELQTAAKLHR